MMGVYIKGMEMPETCIECINSGLRTAIRCSEWTKISAGLREDHRALSCPLVEVPEPHGRLIDKNELTQSTDNVMYKAMIFGGQVCYTQSDVDNASTVIEAESNE